MFTFFGLVASIYAGWRISEMWSRGAGIAVGIVGVVATLSSGIGPFLAIGAAWWIHKKADGSLSVKYQGLDDLLETELDVPDETSYQQPTTETDGPDGWRAQTNADSPDDAWNDNAVQSWDEGGGSGDVTDVEWESSPQETGSDSGPSGGGDEEFDDGRDPYSIEW